MNENDKNEHFMCKYCKLEDKEMKCPTLRTRLKYTLDEDYSKN